MRNAMPKALCLAVVALVLGVLATSPLAAQPPTTHLSSERNGSGATWVVSIRAPILARSMPAAALPFR